MQYLRAGRSGLSVSKICLGTHLYGTRTDPPAARSMIARARDAGINFIDTADQYGRGASEDIVGPAIEGDRDWWILATKVGHTFDDGLNHSGLSRRWIMHQIEGSLSRLRTDHVDVLYLHMEDPATAIEETLSAVGDVIRQGKARYFGVSNHTGWRLAEICVLCRLLGIDQPLLSQPHYNIVDRTPEAEHIVACAYFGLGVVPYSPLARGVLTGKYVPGKDPDPDSRAGLGDRRFLEVEWRKESLEVARKVSARAQSRGMSAAQFAVLWVLNNAQVCSTVCGARTVDQLEGYLAALEHEWTAEDEAFVDALVAPGHPSTPGFTDPQFPARGRFGRIS